MPNLFNVTFTKRIRAWFSRTLFSSFQKCTPPQLCSNYEISRVNLLCNRSKSFGKTSISNPPADELVDAQDVISHPNDYYNIYNLLRIISLDLWSLWRDFGKFSFATWSGKWCLKSIISEISNLCRIIDNIEESASWNPHSINFFLTTESKSIKAPATVHSRIRTAFRFITLLQTNGSTLLPDTLLATALFSILKGMEKSVLKERILHQKKVMSSSRSYFLDTTQIPEQWRQQREVRNSSVIFARFDSNSEIKLHYEDFIAMKNFVISKIILV